MESMAVPYNNGPNDDDQALLDVMSFINNNDPTPTLEEQFDGGTVPSSCPLSDIEVQDFPFSQMWNLANNENIQGSASIPVGGKSNFDQNQGLGFGSSVMLSPLPFFGCCGCCQVLRQIVHFNSDHVMRLEIHGKLGVICHAIQETSGNYVYNSSASTEPQYQTFDFCNKSIEEVKQFLTQYCLERKAEGYYMQQDPLQAFYRTLCVGWDGEWDDILSYPDELISEDSDTNEDVTVPSTSGRRQDEIENQAGETFTNSNVNKRPRLPRFSIAEQRERAGKMVLDDLRAYFRLTIEEASQQLRFCPTVVKRICRKFGVRRWPARKIKSIEKRISGLRSLLNTCSESSRVHVVAEIKTLERELSQVVP